MFGIYIVSCFSNMIAYGEIQTILLKLHEMYAIYIISAIQYEKRNQLTLLTENLTEVRPVNS